MAIPFTCPHCGTYTCVADQYAGQAGPCAACGRTITIPGRTAACPRHERPRSSGGMLALLVIFILGVGVLLFGGLIAALMIPAVSGAREAARRAQCKNNLKQIAMAVHNYHDVHKCFPAAILTDEDGVPRRSWRIAIVPFLPSSGIFYDQYDFNQPWDSPTNQSLTGFGSFYYVCPSEDMPIPGDTNYVMIVGEGTIGGEPNEVVKFAHVTDGLSNTILAIEVASSGIPWLEPRDMTVDEAVEYITDPGAAGWTHAHPGGVNVAMADGSVRFIAESTDPQLLRSMMIRNDAQGDLD